MASPALRTRIEDDTSGMDNGEDSTFSLNQEQKRPLSLSKSSNMIQFTKSISALNSINVSMGVIRAKNAFMSKLSSNKTSHISAADFRKEGEKQWEQVQRNFSSKMVICGIDFTDLE